MSQIKILIADPNEVYLDGIALEFLKREPDRVDLHGITENDYWEEFCGASEEYDIALINERMAGEEIPADRFRYIFILTETMDGTDLSVFSKKDIKTILKWVSASEIYDQVVNGCPFYEILAEREREESGNAKRRTGSAVRRSSGPARRRRGSAARRSSGPARRRRGSAARRKSGHAQRKRDFAARQKRRHVQRKRDFAVRQKSGHAQRKRDFAARQKRRHARRKRDFAARQKRRHAQRKRDFAARQKKSHEGRKRNFVLRRMRGIFRRLRGFVLR